MSMSDRDGLIWYDGKLVPWRDATTHVLTHSLHYGLSVFEGVRAYKIGNRHRHFPLERAHPAPVQLRPRFTRWPCRTRMAEIMEAQREVVRANDLESCYLRPAGVLWLGKDGRLAQGGEGAYRHRRLALGRLPGRGRPEEGHPREDLLLSPATTST